MPGEDSHVGFRRFTALTQCLTPRERGDEGTGFIADPGARHDLVRALSGGFRQIACAELARHVDDADRILDRLPRSWWLAPKQLQLLVTGFGPFLHHVRNPSWDVAQSFAEVLSEQFAVRCERVPVTYADAASFAERKGLEWGQRLVVHFGLRGVGSNVALERYAHNCRGVTPDESDRDEEDRHDWQDVVVPGAPIALETLLEVRKLAAELDARLRPSRAERGASSEASSKQAASNQAAAGELGARMSRDVGEYVCNAIYYHSLRAVSAARQAGSAGEALFVHVPPLDAQLAACVGATFARTFGAHLVASLGAD